MQFAQFAVLICLVAVATVVEGLFDFCGLKCVDKNDKHTVCKTKCKALPNVKLVAPTFEYRQMMLNLHNKLRQQIASGSDTRGDNGAATNMMALSYDMELEFVIACWLSTITKIDHDHCRGVARWKSCGQNLFQCTLLDEMGAPNNNITVHLGMMSYYNEITLVNKGDLTSYQTPKDRNIGHFTQLLWAESAFVGCASAIVTGGPLPILTQGCNYGPPGNYRTEKVYEFGTPASKCPGGVKNKKYNALCGKIRPFEPDAYDPGNPILYEFLHGKKRPKIKRDEKGNKKGDGTTNGKTKNNTKSGCTGLKTLMRGGMLFVVLFHITVN